MATVEQVKELLGNEGNSAFIISEEALNEFLSGETNSDALKSRFIGLMRKYQSLQMSHEALSSEVARIRSENEVLQEDCKALASSLQRKSLAPDSSSLLLEKETASCLNDFLQLQNAQLSRENGRLRVETEHFKASADFAQTRLQNAEAKIAELIDRFSRTKEPLLVSTQPKTSPSKTSLKEIIVAKELARLKNSLITEQNTVIAYRTQNDTLKQSRALLLQYINKLTATARTLQETANSLKETARTAQVSVGFWKTQAEMVQNVVDQERRVRISVVEELKNCAQYAESGVLQTLVRRLMNFSDIPEFPQMEVEEDRPVTVQSIEEPSSALYQQIIATQQQVVDLSEKCSLLEEEGQKLQNVGLLRLLNLMHRCQKVSR